MTLQQLKYVIEIANTGSMNEAAKKLFISQPSLSGAVKELENELGFELVVRRKGHKTIELTPKGEEFISIAERWSSLWKETMAIRNSDDRYLLTIGCTDSLSLAVMAVLKATDKFSVVGVSCGGGVAHNTAQVIMATIMVTGFPWNWYLPVLMIAGLIAGFLIGIADAIIIPRITLGSIREVK